MSLAKSILCFSHSQRWTVATYRECHCEERNDSGAMWQSRRV